jgi:hypothetical protein
MLADTQLTVTLDRFSATADSESVRDEQVSDYRKLAFWYPSGNYQVNKLPSQPGTVRAQSRHAEQSAVHDARSVAADT